MKCCLIGGIIICLALLTGEAFSQQEMRWDFENGDLAGWDIPDWAREQSDHVARSLEITSEMASSGQNSVKIMCEYPGNLWAAAVIEYKQDKDMDLTQFSTISFDVYIPKEANTKLFQGRIIVTAGKWYFIEMRKAVDLNLGEWNTVTASLSTDNVDMAGKSLSYWKCIANKEAVLKDNLDKVKKIAVRVEYDANPSQGGPEYKGPVYIDNIQIK